MCFYSQVKGEHTSECSLFKQDYATKIEQTVRELLAKHVYVSAVVADNAADITAACKRAVDNLRRDFPHGLPVGEMSCIAHTCELVIKQFMQAQDVHFVYAVARSVVAVVKETPEEHQAFLRGTEHVPPDTVETRWRSYIRLLTWALKYMQSAEFPAQALGEMSEACGGDVLVRMRAIIDVLEPLDRLIAASERAATSPIDVKSHLARVWAAVEVAEQGDAFAKVLGGLMRSALAAHIGKLNGVYCFLTFVDWLRSSERFDSEDEPRYAYTGYLWAMVDGVRFLASSIAREPMSEWPVLEGEELETRIKEELEKEITGFYAGTGLYATCRSDLEMKTWVGMSALRDSSVLMRLLSLVDGLAVSEAACESWGSVYKRLYTDERRQMGARRLCDLMMIKYGLSRQQRLFTANAAKQRGREPAPKRRRCADLPGAAVVPVPERVSSALCGKLLSLIPLTCAEDAHATRDALVAARNTELQNAEQRYAAVRADAQRVEVKELELRSKIYAMGAAREKCELLYKSLTEAKAKLAAARAGKGAPKAPPPTIVLRSSAESYELSLTTARRSNRYKATLRQQLQVKVVRVPRCALRPLPAQLTAPTIRPVARQAPRKAQVRKDPPPLKPVESKKALEVVDNDPEYTKKREEANSTALRALTSIGAHLPLIAVVEGVDRVAPLAPPVARCRDEMRRVPVTPSTPVLPEAVPAAGMVTRAAARAAAASHAPQPRRGKRARSTM